MVLTDDAARIDAARVRASPAVSPRLPRDPSPPRSQPAGGAACSASHVCQQWPVANGTTRMGMGKNVAAGVAATRVVQRPPESPRSRDPSASGAGDAGAPRRGATTSPWHSAIALGATAK